MRGASKHTRSAERALTFLLEFYSRTVLIRRTDCPVAHRRIARAQRHIARFDQVDIPVVEQDIDIEAKMLRQESWKTGDDLKSRKSSRAEMRRWSD
jgi:hypothetical protein